MLHTKRFLPLNNERFELHQSEMDILQATSNSIAPLQTMSMYLDYLADHLDLICRHVRCVNKWSWQKKLDTNSVWTQECKKKRENKTHSERRDIFRCLCRHIITLPQLMCSTAASRKTKYTNSPASKLPTNCGEFSHLELYWSVRMILLSSFS